jgi:hypothetical protein
MGEITIQIVRHLEEDIIDDKRLKDFGAFF